MATWGLNCFRSSSHSSSNGRSFGRDGWHRSRRLLYAWLPMQLIRKALRFSGTISFTSKNCSSRSIVIAIWRVARANGFNVTIQFVATLAIAMGLVEYREPDRYVLQNRSSDCAVMCPRFAPVTNVKHPVGTVIFPSH
uniref:Uncharacterized protein n=1 Tax=Anopheles merus TaxID=30066 RepID=A0A182UMD7_ANOME